MTRPSNFPPTRWRKAEDEKPPLGVEVLVVGLSGHTGGQWFEVMSWKEHEDEDYRAWYHDCDIWEGYDVVWWTDLPKAPKIEVVP